jgi:glycosyltransferase involved in cell wall biosynthesis
MKSLTISIIIATLNSQRTLDECLSSIRAQKYPQEDIEIILVDGGSLDDTVDIGNKYRSKILSKKGYGAEAAKSFGLRVAKGEIIADFGSDNIIPDTKWIQRMIQPITQKLYIAGSYPLRYTYSVQDTILNRYVSLFGVNDPIPYYLKKADRQALFFDGYSLAGSALARNGWYEVTFTQYNLPTVGANGFFIRKDILRKAKVDPKNYFHIDVVHDVVKKGHDTFAVVDTGIVHNTAGSLLSLLRKRRRYMKELYLDHTAVRRYHIVDLTRQDDLARLGLFVLFSMTFIQPLWLSLRGFRIKHDIAWFVHPLFCFLITFVYAEAIFSHKLRRLVLDPPGLDS